MNRCPADRSYAMPLTVTIAEYGVSAFRSLTSVFCTNLVLRQCIRPLGGAHVAPGHHGGKRACDLIRRQATAPQAFSRPDRREGEAGARRSCQGWPPLAATVRLGLDGIEHDGMLARSGPSSGELGRCF